MMGTAGGAVLRTTSRLALGLAVSIGCLYLATRGADWTHVRTVLAGAHVPSVLAMLAAGVLGFLVRAQRWRVLLRPTARVGLEATLSATAIGFGASAVLPLRLGEVVRPALLARATGVGLAPALASIVLERLLDILLIIACLLAIGLVHPLPVLLARAAPVLGAGVLAGLAALVVMLRHRAGTEALVGRLLPPAAAHRVGPIVHGLLSGIAALADAGTLLAAVAYSVLLWLMIALSYVCALRALEVPAPLAAGALTTTVVVSAFVFLPQAPGFVGTWQAGCVAALGFFGVGGDLAVGYSLLTWIAMMATSVGLGAAFLVRADLSLRQLFAVGARPQAAAQRAPRRRM